MQLCLDSDIMRMSREIDRVVTENLADLLACQDTTHQEQEVHGLEAHRCCVLQILLTFMLSRCTPRL
jgi:hypothetical protein